MMTSTRASAALAAALLAGCGPLTSRFNPVAVESTLDVAPSPGFADERGDAMLIDPAGQLMRVRASGQRGALEAHPGNPAPVGQVRAVFPMGPHAALVAAEGGLFVAQEGWILSPGWASLIASDQVVGAAEIGDGTAWIAATNGIFRVKDGALSELKVAGQPVTGATAMTAARAEDGTPAVWFSTGEGLKALVPTGPDTLALRTATLSAGDGRNARALVALGDSERLPSELWVLSGNGVFRLDAGGWRGVGLGGAPESLAAAGRTVWLKAGGRLLRYDAEGDEWFEAAGLSGSVTLLAADAAGGAWVNLNGKATSLHLERLPRLVGLDQNMLVQLTDVLVQAVIPPGADAQTVTFQLGAEQIVARPPSFSLGGEGSDGALDAYSLLGLVTGVHTLRATARYSDGTSATREVPFNYQPVDNTPLSFATDIEPINAARCSRCHTSGPGRDLATYDQWVAEAPKIAQAVRDRRMPADGPLDQVSMMKILRWVQSGSLP